MKKILKVSVVTLFVFSGIIIQSCQKDDQFNPKTNFSYHKEKEYGFEKRGTFYGPSVPIGNGTARAWIRLNEYGNPADAGIDLTEKALENLGTTPDSWVLYFPKTKGKSFYKHMLVDWNPQGHEPEHVYDLPHFDFHFYWISNEDRLKIEGVNPPYLDPAPAAEFVPANYVEGPGVVPQMGAHWIDLTSPEFTGGTFTRTFIWGSYQGEFIFVEPMITIAYLETHPDAAIDLSQPSAFQKSGWYPKSYTVKYSQKADKYSVSLKDLRYRHGAGDEEEDEDE